MIQPTDRFTAESPDVVAKIIDGELIIIHLETGLYYSIAQAGTLVWEEIQRGTAVAAIEASVCSRFDVARELAARDVRALIAALVDEQLICRLDHGQTTTAEVTPSAGTQKLPYVTPELAKFSDMAQFFALDPPLPSLDPVEDPD